MLTLISILFDAVWALAMFLLRYFVVYLIVGGGLVWLYTLIFD